MCCHAAAAIFLDHKGFDFGNQLVDIVSLHCFVIAFLSVNLVNRTEQVDPVFTSTTGS
jgi:hypothetical protein